MRLDGLGSNSRDPQGVCAKNKYKHIACCSLLTESCIYTLLTVIQTSQQLVLTKRNSDQFDHLGGESETRRPWAQCLAMRRMLRSLRNNKNKPREENAAILECNGTTHKEHVTQQLKWQDVTRETCRLTKEISLANSEKAL